MSGKHLITRPKFGSRGPYSFFFNYCLARISKVDTFVQGMRLIWLQLIARLNSFVIDALMLSTFSLPQ